MRLGGGATLISRTGFVQYRSYLAVSAILRPTRLTQGVPHVLGRCGEEVRFHLVQQRF